MLRGGLSMAPMRLSLIIHQTLQLHALLYEILLRRLLVVHCRHSCVLGSPQLPQSTSWTRSEDSRKRGDTLGWSEGRNIGLL